MKVCPHCKDRDGSFYVDVTQYYVATISYNDSYEQWDIDNEGTSDCEFDVSKKDALTCIQCRKKMREGDLIEGKA